MKEFNFSKKRKAQLYTIIATMLLCVSACAFSNFDTYAEGNPRLSDLYNFSSSIIYGSEIDSSVTPKHFLTDGSDHTDIQTTFNNKMSVGFEIPDIWYEQQVYKDTETYSCYLFASESSGGVSFIQLPTGSFVVDIPSSVSAGYTGFYIYCPSNSVDHFLTFGGSGSTSSMSYRSLYYKDTVTLDDENSYVIYDVSYLSSYYILNTNMPIHIKEDGNGLIDSMDDVSSDVNPETAPSNIGNVSSEQYDNYEYLTGNSGIYAAITSCNSGKMQFVAQAPTGMNTDNYYIKVNGECSYSVTVNSLTDTRTKNVLSNYTSFESSASSFTKTISASGTIGSSYDLVFDHNGIQLSALNNGVWNQPQENINSELKSSSGSTMWNLANYCTDNSVALWRGVAGSMGGLSANASAGEYGSYGFSLPTMEVVNNSPMTVNSIVYSYTMTMYNENDESVGSLTKTFTINSNGTVSETEGANTLTVPNDVVEQNSVGGADYYNHSTGDTYNDTTNNSTGTGSSGGSSVNGDNNIIINNNPVNNVNGGSGSGLTETDDSSFGSGFGVISKIISYIAGSKGSSVDKIDELANTDGWLSIVTSSYSFVPIQFWNLIITCFTVCLGIVIVAFIISIVIKLVT